MTRLAALLVLLLALAAPAAHATIAPDATVAVHAASATSPTYTATSSNDIILAFIGCGQATTLPTVTGVTGGGLTWTQRSTKVTPTGKGRLSIWYAVASGGFSSTVVATFSSTCTAPVITVQGIAGANTTTPWDSNVSLPASATGTGTAMTVSGVSTTNTLTYAVSGVGADGNSVQTSTGPGGWAQLDAFGDLTGVFWTQRIVGIHNSAPLSSINVTMTAGATATWAMIVDALVDANQPAVGSTLFHWP